MATRKAAPRDIAEVLRVDTLAFPPFWRLDDAGLDDAIRATPHARFRVSTDGDDITGYAVTGRSARRGFLQRLAVDPAHQRRGIGGGPRWTARWLATLAGGAPSSTTPSSPTIGPSPCTSASVSFLNRLACLS